jgi:hypothetical protein
MVKNVPIYTFLKSSFEILQAGDRFGLFGSMGFLLSALMPVERSAVALPSGRWPGMAS